MLEKLNSLGKKKYILFGVPLLCGAIIGTTITLSIPKVKANVSISDQGSSSNQTIDTTGATHATIVTQPPQPTTEQNSPTTAPNAPTSAPVVQSNNNTSSQPAPCK